MKSLIVIVACMALWGCTTVPVTQNFPDVPPALQKSCPELLTVPAGTTKFSDVLTIVTENYALYNECRALNQAWSQWYSEQRTIFESVQ